MPDDWYVLNIKSSVREIFNCIHHPHTTISSVLFQSTKISLLLTPLPPWSCREFQRLQADVDRLRKEHARAEGQRLGQEDQVRHLRRELQSDLYCNTEQRHMDMLIKLKVRTLRVVFTLGHTLPDSDIPCQIVTSCSFELPRIVGIKYSRQEKKKNSSRTMS